MLNSIDKQLDELKNTSGNSKQKDSELEHDIREHLKKHDMISIFENNDGSLGIIKTEVISKELLYSLVANAVLLVLLLTKTAGVW